MLTSDKIALPANWRIERLEKVARALCIAVLNQAGDNSWQKQYDLLEEFVKETQQDDCASEHKE